MLGDEKRCAERYDDGASLAKLRAGKESGWAVLKDVVLVGEEVGLGLGAIGVRVGAAVVIKECMSWKDIFHCPLIGRYAEILGLQPLSATSAAL